MGVYLLPPMSLGGFLYTVHQSELDVWFPVAVFAALLWVDLVIILMGELVDTRGTEARS